VFKAAGFRLVRNSPSPENLNYSAVNRTIQQRMASAGIDINNKKRVEIEENLEKLKFPRLSITYGSQEENYNYLLTMPIYNLTYEKLEELKKQEEIRQTEFDELNEKTSNDIWYEELNELEMAYDKWFKEKQEEKTVVNKKSKTKAKK
jgi:DNA topoisomerase-2